MTPPKSGLQAAQQAYEYEKRANVRQVRRFLAAAHGFLRGEQALIDSAALDLPAALRARLGEIKGVPRNPGKRNRIARLDFLLDNAAKTIAAASALEPDVLASDSVTETDVVEGVSSWLKNASQLADLELPDVPTPPDTTDALDGATSLVSKWAV